VLVLGANCVPFRVGALKGGAGQEQGVPFQGDVRCPKFGAVGKEESGPQVRTPERQAIGLRSWSVRDGDKASSDGDDLRHLLVIAQGIGSDSSDHAPIAGLPLVGLAHFQCRTPYDPRGTVGLSGGTSLDGCGVTGGSLKE